MSDEGFDDWDADFVFQLIQVEEQALSLSNPTQLHHPQPPPPPSSHFGPPPAPPPYDNISYSPPRELSQRVRDGGSKTNDFDQSSIAIGRIVVASVSSRNPKEEEIERLKIELGRVSKQLTHLEQDCLQLRKERDKKEEQLNSIFSQVEEKDVEVQRRKSKNLEYGVHTRDHPGISLGFRNGDSSNNQVGSRINVVTSTCKAIGVQTDKSGESTILSNKNDLSTSQCRQNKLLSVWESSSGQGSPRNLVSKLLVACETDFHVLFGCFNLSSKGTMNSLADARSSDVSLQDHKPPTLSAEAEKVSHLYSMLTKIDSGMVKLDALFEALVDLCSLENDVIMYRSLRVLRMVVNHTFGLEMESHRRDNVIVEGPSLDNTEDIYGFKCAETGTLFSADVDEMSDSGLITFRRSLLNAESLCKKEQRNHGSAVLTSCLDWFSVFELMRQIAMRSTEECVRLEAVSIMNMILMRSNAYLDRGKFARILVFQSISHLLRKESGLSVQKQAVHLLYLLLNCPKLMAMFCSGCKEEVENAGAPNDAKNASSVQGFSAILEGLADCVACGGNGIQELKLRRNAVILVAFLVSSGKPGFEILLGHRLPKRTNFLALILQMLMSEMDIEVENSSQPSEIFRERTLLIREALILLNRLVSNPQYSTPVLRVLTNSRDVACLTVDIANRLSCKGKWFWQSDSMTRQMRESEIVDLARVFKKRVFTFLGESIL
ncbi:hypothetical protein LOK49_LG11G02023 [Camellia lanceoleosa]|uniref:Uncharacterized protein n=1 Tax=Camellia lanceoleosa TaxID=1840588 RepID=A0ACC0G037_9ERIC|nr:hypothetical protein LOK49_LG11G02023 [Camellia lanceoleosa]